MKRRVWFLSILLLLRLFCDVWGASKYQEGETVAVTGNVNKIELKISKYKIEVGQFETVLSGYSKFSQGDKIRMIGNVRRKVINDLMGKIELSEAKIDALTKSNQEAKRVGVNLGFLKWIREKIRAIYERSLPAKEAALVAGIVLGDKEGLSGDFYDQMVRSGTVHIAVASGFNLMILSGSLMSWLFWFLNRRWATIIGVVLAGLYTLMAGAEPPVVRALVMICLLLGGAVLGRKQSAAWALILTAWVMVLSDVGLLGSASFQLSVTASLGLMVVEPKIMRYFETKNSRLIQIFSQLGVTTSVATMLTTGPIIAWHFGRWSLMGVLSNVLILPLVPVIMFLGAMMIPMGSLLSWPLFALSHAVVVLIEWLGK